MPTFIALLRGIHVGTARHWATVRKLQALAHPPGA